MVINLFCYFLDEVVAKLNQSQKEEKMKNRILAFRLKCLTIMVLVLSNTVAAQEAKPDLKESKMYSNAIYGHVGTWVGEFWLTATGCYERMFQKNAQKSKVSTFVKAGYGGVSYWEGGSQYILGHFGILTGIKKHHIEASAGFVKSINNAEFPLYPLSGAVGYRIQKPRGHFIFRAGVGWPEAIYVGIGASF